MHCYCHQRVYKQFLFVCTGVIICGGSGTGKTFLAKEVCKRYDRYRFWRAVTIDLR